MAVRRRPAVLEDRTERTCGSTTQPRLAFPSTRGAFGGEEVWMVGVLGGRGGGEHAKSLELAVLPASRDRWPAL